MSLVVQPEAIRAPLLACGYREDLLRSNFHFGDSRVAPVVAFAHSPADSRSACIAVTTTTRDPRAAVEDCRALGAPVVFVCAEGSIQWWKQGSVAPQFLENIPTRAMGTFFEHNLLNFSPDSVYRAKTWARFKSEYQLSFVDLGLLPLVEKEVGRSLESLIERNVSDLKQNLGLGDEINEATGHWLLKGVFWLLSAKILHDKQVGPFRRLDLTDVSRTFSVLGEHYGVPTIEVRTGKERQSLGEVAESIRKFSSLALTTTESLGYVYENALISKETRVQLGTHSTPSFLVDYVVGNLTDWIEQIPSEERSVFEPACGHAAFLVSAMRLLTELLPQNRVSAKERGPYLRKRLHGSDIDPFALELARLSLTLTDIPNPNGWDLRSGDMFLGSGLEDQAKRSTILLANPPFDSFSKEDRASYLKGRSELRFTNKSAEMLWRTLPHLREGAVFGFVLPQSFLHNKNASNLRSMLLNKFELREICLFPDQVFSFSDVESVVLLGRRRANHSGTSVRYRRVRDGELPAFRTTYEASSTEHLPQSRFSLSETKSLRIPDLNEVWSYCKSNPRLQSIASVGKGLEFRSASKIEAGVLTYSEEEFAGSKRGFIRFDSGLQIHDLPTEFWLNTTAKAVKSARSGTVAGVAQVLLNYAPSSRGPWRLKALLDNLGHPVSTRFIAVRPKDSQYSVFSLWAILNSPLANAYAFSYLGKRDNVVGDIRRLPLPLSTPPFHSLDSVAKAYWEAASSGSDPAKCAELMLDVDCEVLKLYSLPPRSERRLLSIFDQWRRVGVPFVQSQYIPTNLPDELTLSEFRTFERNWAGVNRERGLLIDRKIAGKLSTDEAVRLALLQTYADYHLEAVAPRPFSVLDDLEEEFLSRVPDGRKH